MPGMDLRGSYAALGVLLKTALSMEHGLHVELFDCMNLIGGFVQLETKLLTSAWKRGLSFE